MTVKLRPSAAPLRGAAAAAAGKALRAARVDPACSQPPRPRDKAALAAPRGRWVAVPAARAFDGGDAGRNLTCARDPAEALDVYKRLRPPPGRAYAAEGCLPAPPRPARKTRSCLSRVVFAGDSVFRHATAFLACELGTKVRYAALRGALPANETAHAARLLAAADKKATLVVNFAGLWQVAYGDVEAYGPAVRRLLRVARRSFRRVVVASTTAVYPAHLFGRAACPRSDSVLPGLAPGVARAKRAMTEYRVEALNKAAADAARSERVPVADAWSPTALAADDPLSPGDMRHHGPATLSAVVLALVDAACSKKTRRDSTVY